LRKYLRWTDALQCSIEVTVRSEDPANVWKYGDYRQVARKYNQMVSQVATTVVLPPIPDLYNLNETLVAGTHCRSNRRRPSRAFTSSCGQGRAGQVNTGSCREKLSAAVGYYSEANLKAVEDRGIELSSHRTGSNTPTGGR